MPTAAKKARGAALDLITGLARYAEVASLDQIAVDAATTCRMFGFAEGSSILQMEANPTFPRPIKPTGGDKRWIVSELIEWAVKQAPRSSAKTTWTAKQRAAFDSRRDAGEQAERVA